MLAILSRNFPCSCICMLCFWDDCFFWVCGWNSEVWSFQAEWLSESATEQVFPLGLFIMLCKVAPIFRVCWWNPSDHDHHHENYGALLFIMLYWGDSNLTFESVKLRNLESLTVQNKFFICFRAMKLSLYTLTEQSERWCRGTHWFTSIFRWPILFILVANASDIRLKGYYKRSLVV